MKPTHLLTILALLTSSLAYATPAEETSTFVAPFVRTVGDVRLARFELEKEHPGAPIRFAVKGCTACRTASPIFLHGTETFYEVGVPVAGPVVDGEPTTVTGTRIRGYAVDVEGRSAECAQTPAQFRAKVIAAVGEGAGDPIGLAAVRVHNFCLGGS